jgi:hypothetical protein
MFQTNDNESVVVICRSLRKIENNKNYNDIVYYFIHN